MTGTLFDDVGEDGPEVVTVPAPVLNDGPARMERARQVAEAEARRDAGIRAAGEHAAERWKLDAWEFLVGYLREHETMFVDDLWTAGLPHTREDRALGALFQRASRHGWMVKTGEYRPSVRSNLTVKPVWRSTIYGTSAP